MTVIQLRKFLLDHISEAVEVPSVACSEYTKRQMWEFYYEFCIRSFEKKYHMVKVTENMIKRVLQDFGKEDK